MLLLMMPLLLLLLSSCRMPSMLLLLLMWLSSLILLLMLMLLLLVMLRMCRSLLCAFSFVRRHADPKMPCFRLALFSRANGSWHCRDLRGGPASHGSQHMQPSRLKKQHNFPLHTVSVTSHLAAGAMCNLCDLAVGSCSFAASYRASLGLHLQIQHIVLCPSVTGKTPNIDGEQNAITHNTHRALAKCP